MKTGPRLSRKSFGKKDTMHLPPRITKDRLPIYRVLVSKYDERKAARKLAEQIQSREEIKTTLYGE